MDTWIVASLNKAEAAGVLLKEDVSKIRVNSGMDSIL